MKNIENNNNPIESKIQKPLNVMSPIFGALSFINPLFATIPIIVSVSNEISMFFDNERILRRFQILYDCCEKQKIEIDELKHMIEEIDEHSSYVLRNHIKGLCISALPETAHLYAATIINYLKNDKSSIDEEICEIVSAFNAYDVELLKRINEFVKAEEHPQYNSMINKIEADKLIVEEDRRKGRLGFVDRNVIYGANTIFWEDFCKYYNLFVNDMGIMLIRPGKTMDGSENYDWASIARSILKMQRLGVIEVEFVNSLGTISQNDINRFHLTIFGEKILSILDDIE